jgi:rubredoxin
MKRCPECGSERIDWIEYQMATSSPDDYDGTPSSECVDADVPLGWGCRDCHKIFITEAIKKEALEQLEAVTSEILLHRTVLPDNYQAPWEDEE